MKLYFIQSDNKKFSQSEKEKNIFHIKLFFATDENLPLARSLGGGATPILPIERRTS
jgi:hypothetical protein